MRDEAVPAVLRPPLALRLGASAVLAALLAALVTVLVVPALVGRPDAPGALPWTVAVVLSIAGVVLLVGCWRVRLTASDAAVTRVSLFSDALTITLADARRIEISTAIAGSGSMLPTIVVTGRGDATITSRERRREAETLLPHLLAWSRQRPELVKDAHTLRFLTAYGRTNA